MRRKIPTLNSLVWEITISAQINIQISVKVKNTAWVDLRGNTVTVSRGMAASCELEERVERGEVIGNVQDLVFRDSNYFRAGKLHSNATYCEEIAQRNPSFGLNEILGWIREEFLSFRTSNILVDNLKTKSLILFAPAESVQKQRVM